MGTLIFGMGVTLTACNVETERNDDGSLTMTSVMSDAEVQEELAAARNTDNRTVTADLHDGYIALTVEGQNPETGESGTLTFRATPGIADGHLNIAISEALRNGEPLDAARLTRWNERLATRLDRRADRRPNRTLESVTVTEDTLTMVWRVATPRSRGGQ